MDDYYTDNIIIIVILIIIRWQEELSDDADEEVVVPVPSGRGKQKAMTETRRPTKESTIEASQSFNMLKMILASQKS